MSDMQSMPGMAGMDINDIEYDAYLANDRTLGDPTSIHMQNFLSCVQSRKEADLHDPIANAVPSANLCHMANISYRVGRVLKVEPGATPNFTGDAEATKMVTRPVYRTPYEV